MSNELGKKDTPRYLRVYNYYKELIMSGQLQAGTKLPSIRKGAEQLEISRTTMEASYQILMAEGYIESRPQSGYYVTNIAKRAIKISDSHIDNQKQEKVKYDFRTANVDKDSFKFDLWRRYMKSALRQDERLFSYGEPQGEYEFREVLCEYLRENRNVICTPQQIVIGAGIQSLLHIICPLLKKRENVFFQNQEFQQGKAVFEDYGYCIATDIKQDGIMYVSPSHMGEYGGVLSVGERFKMIETAREKNVLIIEDDYNNEFSYFQHQVPSIQGLTGGQNVIYMGTFSKMLLPSIRMSFMVLPLELLNEYEVRKHFYNQTASKAEQIAITQFIRDGHLSRQIRNSRKIHLSKAAEFKELVEVIFPYAESVQVDESGFFIILKMYSKLKAKYLEKKTADKGVLIQAYNKEGQNLTILLQCTNMTYEKNKEGLRVLKECLEEF